MQSKKPGSDTKVIADHASPCPASADNKHEWLDPDARDEWLKGYKVCSKCGRITKQRQLCD